MIKNCWKRKLEVSELTAQPVGVVQETDIAELVCMMEASAGDVVPGPARPQRAGVVMLSADGWKRKIAKREEVMSVIDSGSMINALPVQAVQAMNL